MDKIKNKFEDGKELLWKKVDPDDLKPGDHIYAYRMCGSYTHHGIYVGDGRVIHYTSTDNKNGLLSISQVKPKTALTYPKCGYQENNGRGVIKTCLDCFRHHNGTLHSIHFFKYDAPQWGYLLKIAGTCSTLSCDKSPKEVVEVAQKSLGSNGFGTYHVIDNNCEHFATYCKTGVSASEQAASYDGFVKKCRDAKECLKKFVECRDPSFSVVEKGAGLGDIAQKGGPMAHRFRCELSPSSYPSQCWISF